MHTVMENGHHMEAIPFGCRATLLGCMEIQPDCRVNLWEDRTFILSMLVECKCFLREDYKCTCTCTLHRLGAYLLCSCLSGDAGRLTGAHSK